MGFGKAKEKLDAAGLKEYAMRVLAQRGHSTAELKEKLRRRAANASDIDGVVAQLKEYGAVDDRRYAENFAASRKSSRGFGRQRVLSDLVKKRVASKVAQKAVEEAYAGADETRMIEEFLERKYRNADLKTELREPSRLASVYRRLRTAGFAAGPAIRVLKRYAAEAELLEGLEDSAD